MGDGNLRKPLQLITIDDDQVVTKIVSEIATRHGMIATELNDPSSIDLKSIENIDVVVLDLMMPDIDGIELLRKFSEVNISKSLILLSGLETKILDMAKATAVSYGFCNIQVIKKPVTQKKISFAFSHLQDNIIPTLSAQFQKFTIDLPDIKQGLNNKEFFLEYQPQLSLSEFSCFGIEALVRWRHPSCGIIYPDAFIELVENSELATEFTLMVIGLALRDLRKLVNEIDYPGLVSINIPPSVLQDWMLADTILSMISSAGLPFEKIQLEITERSLSSNIPVRNDILARLAMRGIKLSIDDFGTGHSSFDQLSSYHFHELKVDKTFILGLLGSSDSQAIVRRIIQLGHDLGMIVVAEGVESEETLEWLQEHHCDVAQGYYLGKPIPYPGLVDWFQKTLPALKPVFPQKNKAVNTI
ncbi:MAG: hypothetical protein CMK46_03395 [Porticoccus sp.]|nr:hypothetical protein [Porticoccus sp.]PHS74487.1 MAG: hypothetical protein COB19_06605 [Porticoccus sp.]|tara:strand:- start:6671 stop:7915 length:1245 start_codon:yes stop_codon:yes gene_type:complete